VWGASPRVWLCRSAEYGVVAVRVDRDEVGRVTGVGFMEVGQTSVSDDDMLTTDGVDVRVADECPCTETCAGLSWVTNAVRGQVATDSCHITWGGQAGIPCPSRPRGSARTAASGDVIVRLARTSQALDGADVPARAAGRGLSAVTAQAWEVSPRTTATADRPPGRHVQQSTNTQICAELTISARVPVPRRRRARA
jgi:hypothetical protein